RTAVERARKPSGVEAEPQLVRAERGHPERHDPGDAAAEERRDDRDGDDPLRPLHRGGSSAGASAGQVGVPRVVRSARAVATDGGIWLAGLDRPRSEDTRMRIVVIGGTGLIGSKTGAILRQRGPEVVAASPRTGVDAVTGEGLAAAMAGTDVVIDVSNSPSFEDRAVLQFFETSTRNLLAAEVAACVG